METNPKKAQMIELTDKDFKVAVITMNKGIKGNRLQWIKGRKFQDKFPDGNCRTEETNICNPE